MRNLVLSFVLSTYSLLAAQSPAVGDKAPDFTLNTNTGTAVRLSERTGQGVTALVVLRGYPGYQCPFCNRQAQDLIANADKLSAAHVRVVMVYPGPGQNMDAHVNEFMSGKQMPSDFTMLLDPDYRFTNAYGLRWDAANETAYPTTYLIGSDGTILFEKSAKSHGARATAEELLAAAPKQPRPASGSTTRSRQDR